MKKLLIVVVLVLGVLSFSIAKEAAAAPAFVTFLEPPSSVFRSLVVPVGGADVSLFGQDCCILDDLIEVYIGKCFIGVFDSRGQTVPPYAGQTLNVSIPDAGTYTVEYRNVESTVGPSGWTVDETVHPYTGNFQRCPPGLLTAPTGGIPGERVPNNPNHAGDHANDHACNNPGAGHRPDNAPPCPSDTP